MYPILKIATLLTLIPSLASASGWSQGDFVAGVEHPIMGADHILAMVAVGVWAATMGKAAMVRVPLGFVSAMAVGFIVAQLGAKLPYVEEMIIASSIAFGLFLVLGFRPKPLLGATIAAAFGLFHGYAHGLELHGATALPFGLGFVFSTAALHAGGVVIGMFIKQAHRKAPQAFGVMALVIGLIFALGL